MLGPAAARRANRRGETSQHDLPPPQRLSDKATAQWNATPPPSDGGGCQ